jgi:hypothetical protein
LRKPESVTEVFSPLAKSEAGLGSCGFDPRKTWKDWDIQLLGQYATEGKGLVETSFPSSSDVERNGDDPIRLQIQPASFVAGLKKRRQRMSQSLMSSEFEL